MTEKTALYRMYGEDNALLYVGVSLKIIHRIQCHLGERDMTKVRFIELEWFDTSGLAYTAEKSAIRRERPLWNSTYNERRVCAKSYVEKADPRLEGRKRRGGKIKYPQPSDEDMKYILDRWYSGDKLSEVAEDVRKRMGANFPASWVRDQVKKKTGSAARQKERS